MITTEAQQSLRESLKMSR